MKVLFMGTGTSTGVPVIGCTCPVCVSDNPRNKRLRSSILLRTASTTLLVDSCPDLRQQALRYHLTAIDAVLYTHEHLDHTAGFDEMRAFCWARQDRLPLYAGTQCLAHLRRMFGWAFSEENTYQGYIRPAAHDHGGKPFTVGDIHITPVPVQHATVETHGYVFEAPGSARFGYVPDIKTLPSRSRPLLQGLDVLAMDALRPGAHRTHLTLEQNVALMRELGVGCGYVTHCGHHLDYEALTRDLPPFMHPAYDGLEIAL